MVAVIRVNKTADYTVMSNSHFREKGMSLKAKGLLSLMLSLPDSWDYSIAGLVTLSKDGKDSVMGALTELENFGYLIRTRTKDESGRFAGYEYDIFENPQTAKPQASEPYSEKPHTEKPTQYNTNQLNTDISNTNDKKKVRKSAAASFDSLIEKYSNGNEEVKALLGDWLKVRKAKRAAMTDRAIELNLQKLDNLAAESGMTVAEYLQEVIRRGWQAFYAIKNYVPTQMQGSGIMDDFNRMNDIIDGGLFDND